MRPATMPEALSRELPDPLLPRLFRVRRRRAELADTFTLDLEPADGGEPLHFQPGQFTMLYRFGVGEVPISISGDPRKSATLVHTIRSVGAVTRSLEKLRRGDLVGVRGPYGTPWPVEPAVGSDLVVVAGGIGLAPLRPALYHFLRHRQKYGRFTLIYGARTPDDLLYRSELESWRSRLDCDVLVTVDRADSSWRGHVGVVTTLIPRAEFDPSRTVALTCGPEIMMRFVASGLEQRGVPRSQVYVSLERNMKCAVGTCGHCQLGPVLICRDGPVFPYDRMARWIATREM
ncbi:MAG: FAD/NAD(P)-binding protein [Candidatus Eremiobacterota bacterium]